jgi:hypothetical protein
VHTLCSLLIGATTEDWQCLQHTHFSPPRMKLFRIAHLADETEGELCGRSFIAADPRIHPAEITL